jgi:hypothetical protein
VLYWEGGTFWRYEVVNKHHTEGSGKATPPVCRYSTFVLSFWGTGMFLEKLFFDKKDREFSALQEYKFVY